MVQERVRRIGANTVTIGLRLRDASYRKRIQTGKFFGEKRTLWNEFDTRGDLIGSYWEADVPGAPVMVYYS